MPHRCPAHDRAHIALLDWAAHWIRLSERAHYASMNWDSVARLGCRVQRPTKPVAPRIQFTPYRVLAVNDWYQQASEPLRRNAVNGYANGLRLTDRQKSYLLAAVAEFLKFG